MSRNTAIVKAMVLIRRPRDGALPVSEHIDPSLAPFQRPLGGHVEFGEYALETVHRELREEIGQELTGARLLVSWKTSSSGTMPPSTRSSSYLLRPLRG